MIALRGPGRAVSVHGAGGWSDATWDPRHKFAGIPQHAPNMRK